jgi:hypothetical protein
MAVMIAGQNGSMQRYMAGAVGCLPGQTSVADLDGSDAGEGQEVFRFALVAAV